MKKRVVVAMSGGVDSSVAAALLRSAGYEVIGITMCFNLPDSKRKRPNCCSVSSIDDASRVAHKLGIKHYTLNLQKALQENVIKEFCLEYLNGRTPNPCVRCNQYIKFDCLLNKALSLDADFLATGHYARITKGDDYVLKKGRDKFKDQSYFLYRLGQKQLKHILFPLGNYTKPQVRGLANNFGLPVADKLASQEICFLAGTDYRAFLKARISKKIKPGKVIDKDGNILGKHQGIAFYTIGQREGLGIAKGFPLYITKIDPLKNQITVGPKEEVLKQEFLVKDLNFILTPIKKKVVLKVKIRYNHKEAKAQLIPVKDGIRVKFTRAQFAITPGQSAVFYDKETLVGGGIIERVWD